ncbi:hypothetical protein ACP70R_034187 [Stipagrostis hirtigluma subsp. patula]
MATTASSGAAYEEQRRKRVLENLKHLEVTRPVSVFLSPRDGGWIWAYRRCRRACSRPRGCRRTRCSWGQAHGVRGALSAARAGPKARKKFEVTEVRRSSRARTTVSYKEDFGELDTFLRHKRRTGRNAEPGREYTGRVASYKQQERAFRRAEKLQDSLDPENPSFVKTMVRSHVSSCFWLGLPSSFCKKNLPSREFKMVLEDEEGVEFDAVYIGTRTGLSGGWRGFAMHHNLEDGDSLVFELAEPDRFKIYIIKAIDEDDAEETEAEADDKNAGGVTKDKKPRKDKKATKEEPDDEASPVAEQSSPEPPKGAKRRKLRGRR